MFRGAKVAVVIPAFNEGDKIAATVRSVPGFVDHVLVIDDASTDDTAAVLARISRRASGRGTRRAIEVLTHERNRGVGAAITTGYQRALALGVDAVAVMAGDGQMDPADLPRLLAPVVTGVADYAKGNRFAWPGCWRAMPLHRVVGNVALSLLTRVATGYLRIFDSQCGYTVASRRALLAVISKLPSGLKSSAAARLPAAPRAMFARYGYPNDLLGRLRIVGARVVDVPVRPIYGAGWRSGIRIPRVILPMLFILSRALLRRLAAALSPARPSAVVPIAAPALDDESRWSSAS
jgi:glycosyltransferase involved in cell wall biosynthesis